MRCEQKWMEVLGEVRWEAWGEVWAEVDVDEVAHDGRHHELLLPGGVALLGEVRVGEALRAPERLVEEDGGVNREV